MHADSLHSQGETPVGRCRAGPEADDSAVTWRAVFNVQRGSGALLW